MTRIPDPKQYWNKHASNYDRSMLLLGRPLAGVGQLVTEAVFGKARVLEVAAGTGLITSYLARSARAVVATDYAPGMVAELQSRMLSQGLTNVQCEQADIYNLPYPEGYFDAIVAANVLHLLPDVPGALRAFRKVLVSSGVFIAPTYCHNETLTSRVWSRILSLTGIPMHRRFTVGSLQTTLQAGGLYIERAMSLSGPIPIGYIEARFV